jgi:hypothetical protein
MVRYTARLFAIAIGALFLLSARPAEAAKSKTFVESDDAKEKDEPQKFLKDYDKLMKGKDADWVFFPDGAGIKKGASVTVKDFEGNGRGHESKDAARDGQDYMEKWLEKQGYKVVPSGGEVTVEGNVFNAWEPHGAARYWGGWAANPGVGMEIMAKDSKGIILAEIRHKAKGSTVRDAVENGLEDMAKALAAGK